MKKLGVTLLVLCLAVAAGYCDKVYYRAADGSWASMEAPVKDGRLQIEIGPQIAPSGEAILVVNKPKWMVLDDTTPPQLSGLKINGTSRPVSTDTLHLGCLTSDTAEVIVGIKDDKNPISAAAVSFSLADALGAKVDVDTSGLGPPKTSGRLMVKMSGLKAGSYEGTLKLTDLAPLGNARSWPVSFTLVGISVSDDMQSISLANSAGSFSFELGVSKQLALPGGMQVYLTGSLAGWVYPAELTDVAVIEDTAEAKTVLIKSTRLQDDKQQAVPEGRARIEYELTIRPDTPCLLVTSRLYNLGENEAGGNFFWGWLPGAYFVTPTQGKQEWEGVAQDKYIEVGKVGWVWLAPRSEGQPGLLWACDCKFTQSRFDTMIIHSPSTKLKTDEFVEMKFAIGPADTPGEAEKMYKDLVQRGLVPEPPAPEE